MEKSPLENIRNQHLALQYAPVVAKNTSAINEREIGSIQIPLIDVYVNDMCNLNCGFCPVKFGNNNLPVEAPKRLKLFSPRVVTLTGGGEPSIYRRGNARIGDFVARIREEMGTIPLGMMTNGVVGISHSVVDELEWLRISLNAATRESYKHLHGKPCFDRVIQNICYYLRSSVEKVGVGFVYMPDNIYELVDFGRLMLDKVAPGVSSSEFGRLSVQFRPVAYEDYSRFLITDDIRRKISEALSALSDSERRFLLNQSNLGQVLENICFSTRGDFNKCFVSLLQVNVDAKGDVYPCPQKAHFFEGSYGNIFDPDFFSRFPSAAVNSFVSHTSSTCPNCSQSAINKIYGNLDFKVIDANKDVVPIFF